MSWTLRRAIRDDLDQIMQLETRIFGNDAWSPANMALDLVNPQCFYLVAEPIGYPGEIDGYAGLFAPGGALESDIQTIAVAETARRGGLGRALMNALINEARKRGARELFLEVRADNPGAQALYESLGFTQIAVRAGYYQPDNVDANVMRLGISSARMRLAVGQK